MHIIKQKIQGKIPFYIFLIFTFCFAFWSLVLPSVLDLVDNANAASFVTPTTIATASTDSVSQLIYTNSKYYSVYSSGTASTQNLYVKSSTDGTTWSSATAIDTGLATSTLVAKYHAGASLFTAVYYDLSTNLVIATSTDAITWTTSTAVASGGFFESTAIANDPSSGLTAVFIMDGTTADITMVTSSLDSVTPVAWNTAVPVYTNASSFDPGDSRFLGAEIDSTGKIHVAFYLVDPTDYDPNGQVIYATSVDGGYTWVSEVVDSKLSFDAGGGLIMSFPINTSFALDSSEKPAVIYTKIDEISGVTMTATTTLVYGTKASGSWVTSTIDTQMQSSVSMTQRYAVTPRLTFWGDNPLISYTRPDVNGYPTFAELVSGSFVTTTVFAEGAQYMAPNNGGQGNTNVAYDSTNSYVGISYVNSAGVVKFSTSSVGNIPTAPTGVGISSVDSVSSISISWTDASSYNTSQVVQYSTDGSTWSTFATVDKDAMTSTITGLSTDTGYYFRVGSTNSAGTSYSSATAITYTLANAPGTPTVGTPTVSTLAITIAENSNPANTTYAIYNQTDSTYVAADGGSSVSAVYQTKTAWGSITVTGLSPNVSYTFIIGAKNGDGTATAASSASTAIYTLANAPGTPTIGTPTTSVLPITIDVNSNPAATTFAIYNVTDSTYVAADGSSSASAVYQTYATWGAGFDITGLTANTTYTFKVYAKNGDGTATAASTASTATYTLANAPSSLTATGGSEQVALSWSGDATTYAVQNVTDSSVQAFAAGTTDTITGLTCGTSYTFKVKGKNGDGVETAYSTSATASTSACASSGGGSSTPTAIPIPTPTLPSTEPAPSSAPSTEVIEIGKSASVTVAGSVHTVTVLNASSNSVQVEVRSEPVLVSVKKGETKEVDVDNDGTNDLRVTFIGLVSGKPNLVLAEILDESKKAVTINNGAAQTQDKKVTLTFNVDNITQFAISEDPSFKDSSFEDYSASKIFTLSDGFELKTIYVRFRNKQGGVVDASDNISYVSTIVEDVVTTDNSCALDIQKPYKTLLNTSVYYVTKDCTKRPFNSANKYFTYFTSWNDVTTVPSSILNNISNDTLGFMPWGPLYDPQYGAVVKVVSDPKTYLLLGGERKWFISETVFKSLGYAWSWVEDIDERLLDKFKVGGEISDLSKHPDHTLIKYKDSNKVYKLQDGKKRYIKDEAAFNKLKYRWDRIVTIKDTEVYPDGEQLK